MGWLLLTLLLTASLAGASSPTLPEVPPPPYGVTLTVLDADDAAVEGATIDVLAFNETLLLARHDGAATTNADGGAPLVLPHKAAAFVVHAPGGTWVTEPATLWSTDHVTVRLLDEERVSSVESRVLDRRGEPLAGARVALYPAPGWGPGALHYQDLPLFGEALVAYPWADPTTTPFLATADDEGRFNVTTVGEARLVWAALPGYTLDHSWRYRSNDTLDHEGPLPLRMRPIPTATLSVTVRDARTGAPVDEGRVCLTPLPGNPLEGTGAEVVMDLDEHGRLREKVVHGPWDLRVLPDRWPVLPWEDPISHGSGGRAVSTPYEPCTRELPDGGCDGTGDDAACRLDNGGILANRTIHLALHGTDEFVVTVTDGERHRYTPGAPIAALAGCLAVAAARRRRGA